MNQPTKTKYRAWLIVVAVALISSIAAAAALRDRWLPGAQRLLSMSDGKAKEGKKAQADKTHSHGADAHSHAGDPHSHGDDSKSAGGNSPSPASQPSKSPSSGSHTAHSHDSEEDANSLELSKLAWKNIGLKIAVVKPQSYIKTVAAPAMVTERPGRSQVKVAAPLTGIVTRVFPIEGEAVQPGQPLFEMRLTHEDLVTAQREFLRSAQELDVVKREIKRLETVGDGVVAGRRIVEQQYAQQNIEAALHAQRQGLLLHGMAEKQIDNILQTRRLLALLTVNAPDFEADADDHELNHIYHVQSIPVKRGQSVSAGESLAVLADHCVLYIEGRAFENDAKHLLRAAQEGTKVSVSAISQGDSVDAIQLELPILYLADHFELESRTQMFYLRLPNHLVRDKEKGEHRFVTWQFRPGQRMSINIPIGEGWKDQIVLPPDAIVNEGAESYVFQEAKDHFDRVAVHVLFRDRNAIVIENDGKLVGKRLAISGAYQMHLAIKNRAGGGAAAHGHAH